MPAGPWRAGVAVTFSARPFWREFGDRPGRKAFGMAAEPLAPASVVSTRFALAENPGRN